MKKTAALISLLLIAQWANTAKLLEVLPVDRQCLVLHFQDGEVQYNWDDTTSGSCNGWDAYHTEDWHLCNDKDQYIAFGQPLDTVVATRTDAFRITSTQDPNFTSEGVSPVSIHRKSKVWEASHDERMPAMHHWIYLELPHPLVRGLDYSIELNSTIHSEVDSVTINWDPEVFKSPAIKVSHVGYPAKAVHKMADVYLWMGDGGERDFSNYTGNKWYLLDTETNQPAFEGSLEFRMENKPEPRFGMDFTGADVWQCDFSEFKTPGNYRLVIEGIGSSAPFTIDNNPLLEAFRTAMQGMFYQRMGASESPAGGFPKARRPLYRQGVEPENFEVRISKRNMVTGVNPDNRDWYAEALTGEVVEASWGGWTDAYDNDQRPVNFICVFDLLLTFYLSPEAFSDDQLYLPESQNGIPDILDEALWEIDWWLRMRDSSGGYLTGLTNIKPPQTINYAGAPCAWQGWCVAAGSAMIADCFRLAGNPQMMKKYLEQARIAYRWAEKQEDVMLDVKVGELRGRDLKMTAAAFLFNLTGEAEFEQVILEESVVKDTLSRIRMMDSWGQQYATVAYLKSPQNISAPDLRDRMLRSVQCQAKTDYISGMETSPTLAARWTSSWEGMALSSMEMSMVAIAHHFSEDPERQQELEKGLLAEAEWSFGRNPLGLVQMTGLTDRAVTQTFAPGRRDGAPGLTPGWTPYMCRDGWKNADDIHRCGWYTNRNYPADKTRWPQGEHFWNSRYSVPNSEATPQQTFRQKIVLYGYLYSLFQ